MIQTIMYALLTIYMIIGYITPLHTRLLQEVLPVYIYLREKLRKVNNDFI